MTSLRARNHVMSSGAVVFRMFHGGCGDRPLARRKIRVYLLLHSVKGHWDFPKGKVDPGETLARAMRREVMEESGIRSLRVVRGFRRELHWTYRFRGFPVSKTTVYRLAMTTQSTIRLSREHGAGGWFAFAAAMKKLRFANARTLLRGANAHLCGRGGRP